MERITSGDPQAYAELYSRYRRPIWSWIRRRTGSEELAADLYQEAFLRVWRSAHTYRPGRPVRPWLWRIATHAVFDRHRRSERRVQTVHYELDELSRPLPEPLATRDLERAIEALSPTLRDAFLLGAVQGFDHNEVAEALDISPANARTRIRRARARLRATLAHSEDR